MLNKPVTYIAIQLCFIFSERPIRGCDIRRYIPAANLILRAKGSKFSEQFYWYGNKIWQLPSNGHSIKNTDHCTRNHYKVCTVDSPVHQFHAMHPNFAYPVLNQIVIVATNPSTHGKRNQVILWTSYVNNIIVIVNVHHWFCFVRKSYFAPSRTVPHKRANGSRQLSKRPYSRSGTWWRQSWLNIRLPGRPYIKIIFDISNWAFNLQVESSVSIIIDYAQLHRIAYTAVCGMFWYWFLNNWYMTLFGAISMRNYVWIA